MRQILLVAGLVGIMVGILYGLSIVIYPLLGVHEIVRPVIEEIEDNYRFDQYSIENLRLRNITPSLITFEEKISEQVKYISYTFSYQVDGKKVTGLANVPLNVENAPVVIMFRGFVDPAEYETGIGTRHAGEYFAENGFITLAPDFLGFGGSDMPSTHPMEERFQRYTAGLTLLSSTEKLLNTSLQSSQITTTANQSAIGIWGHSNGGHISIVLLEATGKNYPTTLWAPVSKPFPYSILYYTDEYEDRGKALRKLVADFENSYDVDKYSLTTYIDWIRAPVLLHQGGNDDAVPIEWSNEFVDVLKEHSIDVTYYTYQNEDHNFSKGSWNSLVRRDVEFFKKTISRRR